MPTPSLLLRYVLAVAFIAPALCGCSSLYLHSASTQEATAEAKAELDKVSLTSVFDNEAAYLDELEKRENAAVAESLIAQRDASLLDMLQGRDVEDGDGRRFMLTRIDGYLQTLAGTSDRGGKTKLWLVIDEARRKVNKANPFPKALDAALKSQRPLLKAPDSPPTPELPSPSGTTLDDALADALKATKDLADKQSVAEKAQSELNQQLDQAEKALAAGNVSQKTFTDLLAKVHSLLQQGKVDDNPFVAELVSESLQKKLDELIEVTDPKGIDQPQDSKARATIGFVHAAFGVGDAFSNPPRVPHPNALAATKAWLQYVASESEVQLAEARSKEVVAQAILAAVAEQVYFLSRAGDTLGPIATKPALAQNEGLSKLLADKSLATSRAANGALYYYAAAWTKGFIPAQQLNEVTNPLIERRAKLQQSRKSGEAWLGTLKPAVATLAAYGEGGVDPHVLAELLQVLGLGAIAVGVN